MSKMVMTNAGIAEVVNAEKNGTAPVKLSHIAFGTGQYTATAERTALQAETKRFAAISGGGVGDNKISVSMMDDSTDAYTVYEVGVFTESGTLFAVYSQTTPLVSKAASSVAMLAVDVVLGEMNPASVTVGDTNFVLNPATTERKGVIEIATEAEAKAATDTERAITAATLQAVIQNHSNIVHRSGAETITGKKTFDANITVNGSIYSASADECLNICGGETVADGAYLRLDSKDSSTPGVFRVVANDGTTTKTLIGKPDGTLMWDGKYVTLQGDCLPVTGGTMTGRINANGIAIGNTVDNGYVSIMGGSDFASGGGAISVYGSNHSLYHGDIILRAKSETGESWLRLRSDGTFTLNGKYITLQGDCLPITGGTMTGNIYSASTNENINICGGETVADGAYLRLDSKDSSTPGVFCVVANDGTNTKALRLEPDGSATWGGKNIVRSVDGVNADTAGNVTINALLKSGGAMTNQISITRDVSDSYLGLFGGTGEKDGAQLDLCGKDHATQPGGFQLHARNAEKDIILRGQTDGRLRWDGNDVITSAGGTMTGSINFTGYYGVAFPDGCSIRKSGNEGVTGLRIATAQTSYSAFTYIELSHSYFKLGAGDGTSSSILSGSPAGALTWKGLDITLGYPKYGAGVAVAASTIKSGYTAPSDGWILFKSGNAGDASISGVFVGHTDYGSTVFVPVKKGDVAKLNASNTPSAVFFPNR